MGSKRCRIPKHRCAESRTQQTACARAAEPASIGCKCRKFRTLRGLVGSGAALAVRGERGRRRTAGAGEASHRREFPRSRFFTNPEIAIWEAGSPSHRSSSRRSRLSRASVGSDRATETNGHTGVAKSGHYVAGARTSAQCAPAHHDRRRAARPRAASSSRRSPRTAPCGSHGAYPRRAALERRHQQAAASTSAWWCPTRVRPPSSAAGQTADVQGADQRRHLRGDDGALGRRPSSCCSSSTRRSWRSPVIHADRGHAEVDSAVHHYLNPIAHFAGTSCTCSSSRSA